MPAVIAQIHRLKAEGVTLYLWSSGGSEYCKSTAQELSIVECFEGFLPKPTAYVDDQPVHEWKLCKHLYPSQAEDATLRKWTNSGQGVYILCIVLGYINSETDRLE